MDLRDWFHNFNSYYQINYFFIAEYQEVFKLSYPQHIISNFKTTNFEIKFTLVNQDQRKCYVPDFDLNCIGHFEIR